MHLSRRKLSFYFPFVSKPGIKRAVAGITAARFRVALELLNDLLKRENSSLTFLCVGGGALMLKYHVRDSTHDLDGAIKPGNSSTRELFYDLTEEVAEQLELPPDWINLQVDSIMKGQGFQDSNFVSDPNFKWSNLELRFAKPDYLLAMKCQALRVGSQDYSDVAALAKILDIRTIEDLKSTVDPYMDWSFIGNDEETLLKLTLAYAFPGDTPYDSLRERALRSRRPR